ncbi:MAG: LUD domain-containing protein [Bacteroidales bacterium]|nr:LUD domain-containing protein [Bacteroidales bacterium]
MQETTTREKIFKQIRHALIEKTESPFADIDFDSPVFKESTDSPDLTFAQQFTKISGKFAYCENEDDMAEKLKYIIQETLGQNVICFEETLKPVLEQHEINFSDQPGELVGSVIGVTYCEYLIARTGSVVISSRQLSGRRLSIFPETHVVVAKTDQLVHDIKDALDGLKKKYAPGFPSAVSVISGPSRTADIEKTLVMGAHGPKELYVLLVEAG